MMNEYFDWHKKFQQKVENKQIYTISDYKKEIKEVQTIKAQIPSELRKDVFLDYLIRWIVSHCIEGWKTNSWRYSTIWIMGKRCIWLVQKDDMTSLNPYYYLSNP